MTDKENETASYPSVQPDDVTLSLTDGRGFLPHTREFPVREPQTNNHDEHYKKQDLQPITIQEEIGARLDKTDLRYEQKHNLIAAIKYIRRLGLKDDVEKECDKIANFLHRAVTGYWIGDE
jgi:hypothetical protein